MHGTKLWLGFSLLVFGIWSFWDRPWTKSLRPLVDRLIIRKAAQNSDIGSVGNIFFLETNNTLLSIHPRVICAIEAAAFHNPHHNVSLVLDVYAKADLKETQYITDTYPNVRIVRKNFTALVQDYPVSQVWKDAQISKYRLHVISDIMRLVLLHKFGGVYLDSDEILIRSLPPYSRFVAFANETKRRVSNGVMAFDRGDKFVEDTLAYLADNFKADKWGQQGPLLLTSMVDSIPGSPKVHEGFPPHVVFGNGIKGLYRKNFYPVSFSHWKLFYIEGKLEEIKRDAVESFGIHYWNFMILTYGEKLILTESQPLFQILKENCPVTEILLHQKLGQTLLS